MKTARVVQFVQVRQLLAEWEKVRAEIVAGEVSGFHASIRRSSVEAVVLAGEYAKNPMEAVKGLIKATATVRREEREEHPAFRSSRM